MNVPTPASTAAVRGTAAACAAPVGRNTTAGPTVRITAARNEVSRVDRVILSAPVNHVEGDTERTYAEVEAGANLFSPQILLLMSP